MRNAIEVVRCAEFYSAVFTLSFEHPEDTIYVAYCYPYTYSKMQLYLLNLEDDPERARNIRRKVLCRTLAGNTVDLITITEPASNPAALTTRPVLHILHCSTSTLS